MTFKVREKFSYHAENVIATALVSMVRFTSRSATETCRQVK
jgi:hypothetical protein